MEEEYAEYRCSACKKAIKNQIIKCKSCTKLFYHPGCLCKHKIYDKNKELVLCPGPFKKIVFEADKKTDMKEASSSRGRMDSTGFTETAGSYATSSSVSRSELDIKIDWLIKTVREMKNESVCKKEIRMVIKEVVQEEVKNVKRKLDKVKRMIQERCTLARGLQRSYSEAVKEKKKENIIIIKPKMHQESEKTKKLIKQKVDIKNM